MIGTEGPGRVSIGLRQAPEREGAWRFFLREGCSGVKRDGVFQGLPVRLLLSLAAIGPGLLGATRPLAAPTAFSAGVRPPAGVETLNTRPDLRNDPRVMAFLQAYGPLIDEVTFQENDAVFTVGERSIHFQDGRMLEAGRLDQADQYDPFFFPYSLGPLTEPPHPEEGPAQSTDVLEVLFGRKESEIRRRCESITFLGRRLFVNTLAAGPLRTVEQEILASARRDPEVARWIEELEIAYSFMSKGIAGSSSRSYHSWGLAVDLVPESYGGKQVYWRWSRVFNWDGWHRIPLAERWSPPRAVVEAFERHGFLWGGKWAHFDTIHFEYRPEILHYNRMLEAAQ